MLPTFEPKNGPRVSVHPAFYVASWIVLSSVTILFNKYILDNAKFHFPAILTSWHLAFASVMTQILARTTTLLDGRKSVKMTGRVYMRAIVPIGILYSASLVFSNMTYLYLSVAFIQMLKAGAPVVVLLTSWMFRVADPNMAILYNVTVIVFGVVLASLGEIKFVWLGFFYQMGGMAAEAIRLIMIQILLSGDGQNMDPLVSLYYYAPVCAVMNFLVAAVTEFSTFQLADIQHVGVFLLLLNAAVAFLLNVSSVMLIGKTSGLVMTLCGVLKNILLVCASVLIWTTVISGLQVLGYSLALAGLVYYGLGYDGIRACYHATQAYSRRLWEGKSEVVTTGPSPGNSPIRPLIRKVLIICFYGLIAFVISLSLVAFQQGASGYIWESVHSFAAPES